MKWIYYLWSYPNYGNTHYCFMNHLIFWNDLILFIGSNPRAVREHSHPVVQFVMATEGFFLSKINEDWIEKKAMLISPNHHHECDAQNIPITSMDIDPDSSLGEWIMEHQLKNKTVLSYHQEDLSLLNINNLLTHLENKNWEALRKLIEAFFGYRPHNLSSEKDDRIKNVLNYISANIENHISTKDLMSVTHLSESRLLHLFKEQMGLPIRNYILWFRLKIVLQQIITGKSLTEAAHFAGFSDQAHMTRTCVKMIGVPPSLISKNSKFIQVNFPQ